MEILDLEIRELIMDLRTGIQKIIHSRSRATHHKRQFLVFLSITKTRGHILTIDIIIISDKCFFDGLRFEIYDTVGSEFHSRRHQNPDYHENDKHFHQCEPLFYKDKPLFHMYAQIKNNIYVVIITKLSTKIRLTVND